MRGSKLGLARLQYLLESLDRTIDFDRSTFGGDLTIGSSSSDVLTVAGEMTGSQGALFSKKVNISNTTADGQTNRIMLRLHNDRSDDADNFDWGSISIDFDIENASGGAKTASARISAVAVPSGSESHTSVTGEQNSALIFSTMRGDESPPGTLNEAMRINHLGSLGIGTTEPATSLDVTGSAGIRLRSTNNAANSIYLHTDAGTSETIKIHSDQGTSVTEGAASVSLLSDAGGVELRSTANLANAVNITADGGTTSTITIFNDQGTSVTEGAESIAILSDAGGVGIRSTANLANAVNITADGGTASTITIFNDQGTSVTEGAESIAILSDAGGVGIRSTADLANAVNITADGGTTSTITIFNDPGTAASDGASSIQVTSDVGRIELLSGLNATKAIYLHTDGGSSESIYLHNTQGTGQGAITLHAPAGGAYILANKASAYGLFVDNNGGNQNRYVVKARGGADNGTGTTHYFYAEDGDGTAVGSIKNVSGTFQLADASDRRLKKNIVDTVINALEIIADVKVRDFDWIRNDIHCVAGFIAQELQEVFPSAADGSEDQVDPETGETIYMTASRDVLVPVLVKAVQELTARVVALEAE